MPEPQRQLPPRPVRWGASIDGRPFEAVRDAAELDGVGGGELDLIVRDLASRADAEVGLLAVADQTEGIVEVLAVWGKSATSLNGPSVALTDGFVGRALQLKRAAIEPLHP